MFTDILHPLQENSSLFVFLIGLLGLFVGSFLNVVIYRLPLRLQHEWRSECKEFLGKTIISDEKDSISIVIRQSYFL